MTSALITQYIYKFKLHKNFDNGGLQNEMNKITIFGKRAILKTTMIVIVVLLVIVPSGVVTAHQNEKLQKTYEVTLSGINA